MERWKERKKICLVQVLVLGRDGKVSDPAMLHEGDHMEAIESGIRMQSAGDLVDHPSSM